MSEPFCYPRFEIGSRAIYGRIKIKITQMRWDSVHSEFQYLISGSATSGIWVSEKVIEAP